MGIINYNVIVFPTDNSGRRSRERHISATDQDDLCAQSLLEFAVKTRPLSDVICKFWRNSIPAGGHILACPSDISVGSDERGIKKISTDKDLPGEIFKTNGKSDKWCVLSNVKFASIVRWEWLLEILDDIQADIVTFQPRPDLCTGSQKVLVTSDNCLVGFRRFYEDSFRLTPLHEDWPAHVFIKQNVLHRLTLDNKFPLDFDKFLRLCRDNSLRATGLETAGRKFDLSTADGLICFVSTVLAADNVSRFGMKNLVAHRVCTPPAKSETAKLMGTVLCAEQVEIDENSVVVGPVVLSDNVKVQKGAVVKNSLIGPGVSISPGQLVENRILLKPDNTPSIPSSVEVFHASQMQKPPKAKTGQPTPMFRVWSWFSYPAYCKRLADIVVAIIVLVLFAPLFPFIALAITLSSRGPVFFKHRRQGLHGKEFNCVKFRSMLIGADEIQEKLRVLNEADGPQFKMEDDPRISTVGRFLRNTYIDEIPQFINVLLGQMSVVGPRPSPELENTQCPSWRNARLSVRPGITGLWQVCRTRQPMRDFQEWIYYDTMYVKQISLKLDIWICWKTFSKMVVNFISQF